MTAATPSRPGGCELCGQTGAMEPLYPEQDIVRCPVCGLVGFAGSAPVEELYTHEYFSGGEYYDYVADKPILQRNFRRRISELRRLVPSGRLLEIGAAHGFFLELAQSHWGVRGFEISGDAASYAREVTGVDVERADFLGQPDEPEAYDLICMWDTVEHLVHPVRVIKKAGRWLKPGGYLALTTGNIASPMARLRKQRWRLIHPPTHLYYFSPETLCQAATQAGLQVSRVGSVGYVRSYRSMLYALLMQGWRRPLLYALATLGGKLDMPVYLNLGDIMMLVARKPPAIGSAAPAGE